MLKLSNFSKSALTIFVNKLKKTINIFFSFSIFVFSWSGCSRDCGMGFQTRSRSCLGRGQCSGLSEEVAECNTNICPDNDNEKVLNGKRYSVCKMYGDPHVKRFDGTFIDLLDYGYYTMVESRYLSDSKLKTKYRLMIESDEKSFRILESEK